MTRILCQCLTLKSFLAIEPLIYFKWMKTIKFYGKCLYLHKSLPMCDISFQGYGVIELPAFSLLYEVNAFL